VTQNEATSQKTLEKLSLALDSGTFVDVRRMLNGLPPGDVAHLLESSTPKFRHILWKLVEDENEGEVLNELSDELRIQFLGDMEATKVAELMEGLEDDDVADILQQLPDRITWEVLNSMDQQDRARLERVMLYPEDTAGGLMNTDTITVRAPLTLDVVLRYLRRHESIPEMTDNLIVVRCRTDTRRHVRHRGGAAVRTQRLGIRPGGGRGGPAGGPHHDRRRGRRHPRGRRSLLHVHGGPG
jgi:magnesium transporter